MIFVASGMDILEVDTLEEAMEISKNDPLAKGNWIRQDIKAWSTDLEVRQKMFAAALDNLG